MATDIPQNLLTIAGTDPSGAAGLQADLQVFRDFGFHGLSVVTAVVSQNTVGVRSYQAMAARVMRAQLEAVADDLDIAGIKIGMLPTAACVEEVVRFLNRLDLPKPFVVLDPLMASGDGKTAMLESAAVRAMRERLFRHVDVLTPNVPEAEALLGRTIATRDELEVAAHDLRALGCDAVLLKGGHLEREPGAPVVDAWADARRTLLLEPLPAIEEDVRGTGCQLASAVLAAMVRGLEPLDAARSARNYLGRMLHNRRATPGMGRSILVRPEACVPQHVFVTTS